MKEILVIQAARFGDLMQTRRLILTLAQKARVHLALDESLAPLAKIVYPQSELHSLKFHCSPDAANLAKNLSVFRDLQSAGFARVFNCNFSRLTGALGRLFPEDRLFGYRPARASLGGLLRSPWARIGFRASESRKTATLNLVDFWGWFAEEPISPLEVNPPAKAGGGGIGVAVAGREARRSLPVPVLAGAAKAVFRTLKSSEIKLFGSKAEIPAARRLLREFSPDMRAATKDLCGQTGWPELVDEMRGLDLLLSPDTGLMHLGAFLGVPVVAFFLSSAWLHETGPYGLGHTIFQAAPACAPCLESAPCPKNLACHEIFANPGFLRSLVQVINGSEKPAAPANLQIWRGGFDDLGAMPTLAAGEDAYAQSRAASRRILREKLGLADQIADDSPAYEHVLERFEPQGEWMLPPWRYC